MWATLTTNIAANVVAPANAFVNCAPKWISFEVRSGLTCACACTCGNADCVAAHVVTQSA